MKSSVPLALPVTRGDEMVQSYSDRPMSLQVWHDKAPSLLKGQKKKPIMYSFIGNGD
jgi:hypothetical protein